jgi:hypothetical protein
VLCPATPADVPALVGLLAELEVFEHFEHDVMVMPESLPP